jgi:hypothetical protein
MSEPAYGNTDWCADRLGISRDKFMRLRQRLEAEGFPKRDRVLNQWLRADVETWLLLRRRVTTAAPQAREKGIKYGSL